MHKHVLYAVFAASIFIAPVAVPSALADEISGSVCVTDGSHLSVGGVRKSRYCQGGTKVRLLGIDAPDVKQLCTHSNGRAFRCGLFSAGFLLKQFKGKTTTCVGEKTDNDGQLIAVCKVGNVDINALMVREGWAVATPDSNKYIPDQSAAKAFHKGMWEMTFEMPWVWRTSH